MCLVVLGIRVRSDYPLVLAANRDEFFQRPTSSAGFWSDSPEVLAGRDELSKGAWTGINLSGRLAVVTNIRDPRMFRQSAQSRGHLVRDFLEQGSSLESFIQGLISSAHAHNAFNLLLGSGADLYAFSSPGKRFCRLRPGIHCLSNSLLNEPWPKVERAKQGLRRILTKTEAPEYTELFSLLADTREAEPERLPQTGIGPEWERFLSPVFIRGKSYGTRSSTLILMDRQGGLHFRERTFSADDHSRGAPHTWSAPDAEYSITPRFPPEAKTSGAGGIPPACPGSTW